MSKKKTATVEYFPHYARHGKTIFTLENLYGNDGYAAFYKLLELLAVSEGHYYDAGTEANREYLAAVTGGSWDSRAGMLTKLAHMGVIDAELWEKVQVVWMPSFLDSVREVYRKRAIPAPERPLTSTFRAGLPAEVANPTQPATFNRKVNESRVDESRVDERKDNGPAETQALPVPYDEIINYLNKKTGKNFQATTKETRARIRARFAGGASLQDFVRVIDTMTIKWANDPKMADFLRPETLFGNKFESYLNSTATLVDKGVISKEAQSTVSAIQGWLGKEAKNAT